MINLEHDIHIWVIKVDTCTPASSNAGDSQDSFLESFLPKSEKEESLHYGNNLEGKMRFLVRRAARRSILQKYTGIPAKELLIQQDSGSGRPTLNRAQNDREICFSSTSSESLAVIAVARGQSLGVDIEKMKALPDEEIMRLLFNFFSKAEYAQIQCSDSPDLRQEQFFKLWTLKEAWLKATGQGLAQSLDSFSISLGNPPTLVGVPEDERLHTSAWGFTTFVPGNSYTGAIAFEATPYSRRTILKQFANDDLLSPSA